MKDLIEYIEAECDGLDEGEMYERYDQMLDECSESCTTCKSYGASRIIKEMDPIAYRCGFCDWEDGELRETYYRIDSSYYERREVDKKKEDFISELQANLDTLENEQEDDPDGSEWDAEQEKEQQQKIDEAKARLDEAEKYTFD